MKKKQLKKKIKQLKGENEMLYNISRMLISGEAYEEDSSDCGDSGGGLVQVGSGDRLVGPFVGCTGYSGSVDPTGIDSGENQGPTTGPENGGGVQPTQADSTQGSTSNSTSGNATTWIYGGSTGSTATPEQTGDLDRFAARALRTAVVWNEETNAKNRALLRWQVLQSAMLQTYEIGRSNSEDWITCMCCGLKSFNANDIKNKYCKACGRFH